MEENLLQLKNNIMLTHYTYLKQKLREIEQTEIEGYKKRVKYLGTYEKGEPDIAFYSTLGEKKISKEAIGQLAEDKDGTEKSQIWPFLPFFEILTSKNGAKNEIFKNSKMTFG